MKTLDAVRLAGQTPVYDFLDFGGYHASLAGQGIKVRVNPPQAITRAMMETYEKSKDADDNVNVADDYILIAAKLLTQDGDNDNTPLDGAEFLEFIKSPASDADAAFRIWLLRAIYEKVTEHFLSIAPSTTR